MNKQLVFVFFKKIAEILLLFILLLVFAALIKVLMPEMAKSWTVSGGKDFLPSLLFSLKYSSSYVGLDIFNLLGEAILNSFMLLSVSSLFILIISIIFAYKRAIYQSRNVHIVNRKNKKLISLGLEQLIFLLSSFPSYILAVLLFIIFPNVNVYILALISVIVGSNILSELSSYAARFMLKESRAQYLDNALMLKYSPRAALPGFLNVGYHIFRSTLPEVLTLLKNKLPVLLGNILIVELIFSIRGLSSLLLIGFANFDIPLIINALLLSLLMNYGLDLIFSISLQLLNPEGH